MVVKIPKLNFESYIFISDYFYKQSLAISTRDEEVLEYGSVLVYFNTSGNVRQSQTFKINNTTLTSHLGGGRLEKK
ncbi:MAG: hypothetical protein ACK5KQ_06755 [Anaerorhabdus sp.]